MTSTSVADQLSTTREGETMILYLVETMRRLNVDTHTFFRMAHIRMFGTDPDLSNDVCQFHLHALVPKYVQAYLKLLQQG
jgi:hypothetical protein